MLPQRLPFCLILCCTFSAAVAQTTPGQAPAPSPSSPATATPPPPIAAPAVTPSPPVKMGLWENTTTLQISGFQLPPDVVARLQAAGRPVPNMGAHSIVTHGCLTPDEWQKQMEHMNDPNGNCVISNRTIDGGKWSFDISCTSGRGMTMTGHFDFDVADDEHATGTAHMKADGLGPNAQTIASDMTFTSHRLGADCGDIKPGSAKIISSSNQ